MEQLKLKFEADILVTIKSPNELQTYEIVEAHFECYLVLQSCKVGGIVRQALETKFKSLAGARYVAGAMSFYDKT